MLIGQCRDSDQGTLTTGSEDTGISFYTLLSCLLLSSVVLLVPQAKYQVEVSGCFGRFWVMLSVS